MTIEIWEYKHIRWMLHHQKQKADIWIIKKLFATHYSHTPENVIHACKRYCKNDSIYE